MIEKLVNKIEINSDTVLLAGDFTRFLLLNKMDMQSIHKFLDLMQKKVKNILIPTYNWDFCKGKTFDIKNTPSQTGILGKIALSRDDFKRTKHPVYSFAVWGEDGDYLVNLDNVESFDKNSPFGYLHRKNAQMVIFDKNLQHSFTFVHYVEYMNKELVDYRYVKFFEADYVDENGNKSRRKYSMFVRDLDKNVQTFLEDLERLFVEKNIMHLKTVEGITVRNINLSKAYDFIKNDIKNGAKHIHKKGKI